MCHVLPSIYGRSRQSGCHRDVGGGLECGGGGGRGGPGLL